MKTKLLFPLLLLCCQVWSIRPPQIDGEEMQDVEKFGDLILHCRGSKALHWENVDQTSDYVQVTNTVEEGADLPHLSTLEIKEIFPFDAGYYYCRYNDSNDSSNDKKSVASVFVFVNGRDQSFLYHHLNPAPIRPAGETLHIFCAVTNRNYNVTLKINGIDVTEEDRVKYDPTKGFSIENVTMEDQGLYVCESGGKKQEVRVTITNVNPEDETCIKEQEKCEGVRWYPCCFVSLIPTINIYIYLTQQGAPTRFGGFFNLLP
ncbi:vascular endothelial growth factor receptor kdr-like isoform X2 [Portunus trituberculatus]|uniref:vascular endothelial growth factor receptor kdr-like isoform X2 n=1 Tax=Portunus trituberculatus TaxID=210409 RepID=UPI001E1CB5DB|nr:vascular endothelial growth factor receptor kdr-like isoform X2 [Portunus trituberculatus]